ncbi:MAG TPA: hypothetical protein VLB49_00170 [Gemmatimonadales bacterium]|nr:hypothetical protein [Gemmatimonadales bacterium]
MTTHQCRSAAFLVLSGLVLSGCGSGTRRSESGLQEASANFDLQDVEPFLTRVVALLDSGFTSTDVKDLARTLAAQPAKSERRYEYTVIAGGTRGPLQILVFMDDVDSPDITFFADSGLAARIQAAAKQYFVDVGK